MVPLYIFIAFAVGVLLTLALQSKSRLEHIELPLRQRLKALHEMVESLPPAAPEREELLVEIQALRNLLESPAAD